MATPLSASNSVLRRATPRSTRPAAAARKGGTRVSTRMSWNPGFMAARKKAAAAPSDASRPSNARAAQ